MLCRSIKRKLSMANKIFSVRLESEQHEPDFSEESILDFEYQNTGGLMVSGQLSEDTVKDLETIEAESQEVDQFINVGYSLESIHEALSKNTQQPMSRPIAFAMDAALQQMLGQQQRFVSLEHFEGKHGRIHGTKLALEDISAKIRTITAKIIRWIKRMVEIVYDVIENIVRGADSTGKAAEKLQDLATQCKNKYGDNAGTNAVVRNKKLAVFIDNMSAKEIQEKYHSFCTTFNEALSQRTAGLGGQYLIGQIHNIINKNKSGLFDENAARMLSNEAITQMLKVNFNQFTKNKDGEYQYLLPFGGDAFVITVEEHNGLKSGLSFTEINVTESASETAPVLTPDEVIEIARMIETSMHKGIYRDYRKTKAGLYSMKNKVLELCDAMSRQQRDTMKGDLPSLHFLKTITDTMFSMVKETYSYNGYAARALLKYGHESLLVLAKESK